MLPPALTRRLSFSVALVALAAAATAFTDPSSFDNASVPSSSPEPTSPTETGFAKRDWLSSLLNGLLGAILGTVLTALQQNGNSLWGTLAAKLLPLFRSDGGTVIVNGVPWGTITPGNANPYTSAPQTGVTRTYNFKIAPCNVRPDGVMTNGALCINGQFPGPLIEANYGDTIQVTVTNGLTGEGTSIHWHGFLQTNTNWEDGVPGVTQCPIAPGMLFWDFESVGAIANGIAGQSYTYSFRATLYGSTWYHSHYSAQYASGIVGPMVIYGPFDMGFDVDIGPVMLQEWYRQPYMTYVRGLMQPLAKGGPQLALANSNLINGKMRFPCVKTLLNCATADYAKFNFTSGKFHRLRLINTGASAIQKFAIDGHDMYVIANDFMPIVPYKTSMITLGVGQRADVIVYGSGRQGDRYWMRSNMIGCSLNDGLLTEALGIIYYQGSDYKSLPSAFANIGPAATTALPACGNDALTLTVPAFPLAAATNPLTKEFEIRMKSNGTNMLLYLGANSFHVDFNDPLLAHALANDSTPAAPARNAWYTGNAPAVRAVIYNYDDAPHPVHLHGHNAQVLAVGLGKWDSTVIRPSNPQRRDVFIMPPGSALIPSYLVLQWGQDNPGVWPLHCHFAWHASLGLLANVVARQADLLGSRAVGQAALRQTCDAWNAWTKGVGVLATGIDSGLRVRGGNGTGRGTGAAGVGGEEEGEGEWWGGNNATTNVVLGG